MREHLVGAAGARLARRLSRWGALAVVAGALACSGGNATNDVSDVLSGDATGEVDAVPTGLDDCGRPRATVPEGCSGCHGAPPAAPHVPNAHCERCHGFDVGVVDGQVAITRPELHQDGTVQVAVGCSSCHGWDLGVSPPQDLRAGCDPASRGVGSHRAMREAPLLAHRVGCPNCHVVPTEVDQAGHLDGDNVAEVTFGMLATVGGVTPVWNGTTCASVYCHGATLKGGTLKTPTWGDASGAASACGACHALAAPDGDTEADCSSCHPTSVDEARDILPAGTHLDGVVDLVDGLAPAEGGLR
jgi:predicted CxxxxCH...CXXCH cytochrome family protein